MGPYIARHLFGTGAAAVVVLALWWGWPIHNSVAQVDTTADDNILAVGRCIEADASIGPLEVALIRRDIIEEDLLQTKVTYGMCNDMLEGIPDASLVRKLAAAQNYIQEIKLIEEAMRRADGEAAAKVTNRHFLATRPPVVAWTVVAAFQGAAEAQYPEPPAPTAEPAPDGGGGAEPAPGTAEPAPGGGGAEPAPTGPRYGEGDGMGVTPTRKQAASAASAGEDDDASLDERLRQKEAALRKEGASAPEAAAGGRCSLEVDLADEKADEIEDLQAYKIKPLIPEKMGHRETEQAGLVVSPVTKEILQEIRQKHADAAEASESAIGCVELADWMKATLVPYHSEELGTRGYQPDIRELSSNRNTRWGWDITAHRTGNLELLLHLRYAISREGQEFRLVPGSPVYDGAIKVTTPLQNDSAQKATEQKALERPWWQRIFGGIFERIFKFFGG
jgi:hypothetical protein